MFMTIYQLIMVLLRKVTRAGRLLLMMEGLIQQSFRVNMHLSKNMIFTLRSRVLTVDLKESLLAEDQVEQHGIHQIIIKRLF